MQHSSNTPTGSAPKSDLATSDLTIYTVRSMRLAIRTLRNTAAILPKNYYVSMAHTSLEKAAMWLGDILSVLGETSPYVQGYREPTDETTEVCSWMHDKEGVSTVKALWMLRTYIGAQELAVLYWLANFYGPSIMTTEQVKMIMALQACYTHLREARLDLGIVLGATSKGTAVQS